MGGGGALTLRISKKRRRNKKKGPWGQTEKERGESEEKG